MFDRVLRGLRQAKEWSGQALSTLCPQQRNLLLRGAPVLLLALALGGYLLQRERYRPLFTNLSPQDAAAVMRELDAQKIPYLLRQEGSVIEVPEEVLYRTRLELAGKGLPLAGGVGFEIFEQTPFGMSEFAQRVNYLRALQGELARTINTLAAVQSSRVHIALPARSGLFGAPEKASASVVIDLKPGYHLTPEQVQGVINLVAASVEGLTPERVTVVDTLGRPLRSTAEETTSESELLHRLTRRLEQEMEGRIETMLEPVLGPGKAVARVTVELDFRETQLAQEAFDPAGQVIRSQQQELEEQPPLGGVPGAQANIPGGDAEKLKEAPLKRENRIVNYEIGRTTRQVVEPRGQIRRLSVAVLVDGKYRGDEYISRTPEEMEVLRAIVMKAIGFNAERGDQVEVANIPFNTGPQAQGQEATSGGFHWLRSPWSIGVGGGVLLLLLFLALRWGWRRRQPVPEQPLVMEQARRELEDLSGTVEKVVVVSDPRREQLAQIAREHKEVTVQIIRMWLKEGQRKKPEVEEQIGG
ncbi:MAG: flagellar basal-body MS-ring/collar protein FliF [Candidatus Binatia bacterium]|nr:flagellar basal-body MS-ring/collar protein FliF [Candidatus Binatia bacterium]